jgi:hypothetical protein
MLGDPVLGRKRPVERSISSARPSVKIGRLPILQTRAAPMLEGSQVLVDIDNQRDFLKPTGALTPSPE